MLHDIERAVIIYNPLAGGDRERRASQLERARDVLAQSGIRAELVPTTEPHEAGRIAVQAAHDGAQLIVACGGDGTLNETVNGMARDALASQIPLAVLPAGTANVLAKELRIPRDIPRAAAMIPHGTVMRIAIGRVSQPDVPRSDRYFVCVAGAGADAALVHSLDITVKHRVGILAYWLEGFKQLWRYKFPHFRVTTDGGRESSAALLVVGRTKHYGGPFQITRGANLFDDEFEIALFESRWAPSYLGYMPAAWLGMLPNLSKVKFLKTRTLVCEPLDAAAEVFAQVDGEPTHRLPVKFEIVPDALALVVPEQVAAMKSHPARVLEPKIAPQVEAPAEAGPA